MMKLFKIRNTHRDKVDNMIVCLLHTGEWGE